MGKIKVYPPVKLFVAITFSPIVQIDKICHRLEQLLSPIDSKSIVYPFNFTTYYETEMGKGLRKQMISFKELLPAEVLVDLKISTNAIEDEFRKTHGRTVNIDPGYICSAKLILATTKDYDHRVYLNRGIFADVHLRFRNGHFQTNPWTYPDYQQPQIIAYFEEVRKVYLNQLTEWKKFNLKDQ